MDLLDLFIAALFTGISLLLLLQMSVTFGRTRNTRVLLLAIGFTLFFVEGALLLAGQAGLISPGLSMSRELLMLNLLIVLLLYAGTVKG